MLFTSMLAETTYAELAAIPSIISARPVSSSAIEIKASIKDNDRKYTYTQVLVDGVSSTPAPVDEQVKLTSHSPSGALRALIIVRESAPKLMLQVWRGTELLNTVDCDKVHGDFAIDDTFGGYIDWSKDETQLLYVAEQLPPSDAPKDSLGKSKFDYEETWGERMKSRTFTVVVRVQNILDARVSINVVHLPTETLPRGNPTQAIFGPCAKSIVFRYLNAATRRYGIVYCHNRPATLLQCDLDGNNCFTLLDVQGQDLCAKMNLSPRSPRMHPSETFMVFLAKNLGGAHNGCSRMFKYEFGTKKMSILVDEVSDPSAPGFPGLYLDTIPQYSWCQKDSGLVLVSAWRSATALLRIDLQTGTVHRISVPEIESNGHLSYVSVMGVFGDRILITLSSPTHPTSLFEGQVYAEASVILSVHWHKLMDPRTQSMKSQLESLSWHVQVHSERSPILEAIYVYPPSSSSPLPAIIFPHGGPHGAFPSNWSMTMAAYALHGYICVMVNYTGSTGFGQKHVDALVGKIGTLDVEDCHCVAQQLLNDPRVDGAKIGVCGGSHGGFLTGHLVGKYPDFYKIGILRNPVLNVGTNLVLSDIPDWSYLEAGFDYAYTRPPYASPPPDVYASLYNASPAANVADVKCPLLFLIGQEDKRVPNYEAINWYYYLKGKGRDVKMLSFPKDGHPLDSVDAERASLEASLSFLKKHLA